MKIRAIKEHDWKAIVTLQQQAYTDIEPESEPVLRRKCVISPTTCMVAVDNDENLLGCCLSHPWQSCAAPPLHEEIATPVATTNLFIHDMAVFPQFWKKRVGTSLYESLLERASKQGFKTITLVAVQQARTFWSQLGFSENANIPLHQAYGAGAMFMELELNT